MKPIYTRDQRTLAKMLALEDGRAWRLLTVAEVRHYMTAALAELEGDGEASLASSKLSQQ